MDRSGLERAVDELCRQSGRWAALPVQRKAQLLRQCLPNVARVAERQVHAALEAKGWPADLMGEELLAGPVVVARNLRLLLRSLEQIAHSGAPRLPRGSVSRRADEQWVFRVLPSDLYDSALYRGIVGEVWLQPGAGSGDSAELLACSHRGPPVGRVALVLGGGNQASIAPLDLAYKLFVENRVCLLKMNPVNAYLAPFIEQVFAPLLREGVLRLVQGGADVGATLCQHPGVDEIHITGSAATHDAIVFGSGAEGVDRKRRDAPINPKPISSELGTIGPVIIVPGQWSLAELRFQAENVATQLVNNAGFNCNAARVLVTQRGWAQRDAFLGQLRDVLCSIPTRPAYYPGAHQRQQAVVAAHPHADQIGRCDGSRLPWTLVTGLDSDKADEICFAQEAFCSVLAETSLPAADPAEFLLSAARWCNHRLWGTLNAEILIDPSTARRCAAELDEAVATLRYGSVAVNHWPALSYGLGTTTWGAFPGHTRQDIQSGIGVVHNSYMFEQVQKTVLKGPFTLFPKPPWFVTHRNQLAVARRLLRFETAPAARLLPGIFAAALKG